MNAPRREQFRFFSRLSTRWGDVDRVGHVNNAKYFTYDEQARTEYFAERLAGTPEGDAASSLILAHIACDFLAQLHHPAQIDHGLRISRIGRRSLGTEGAVFVGGQCFARTSGVVVWFDYARQITVDVPDWVRHTLRDYEIVKPAE